MLRLIALLVLTLAAPQWAAAQTSFNKIVVFGTSLSDAGNAFALVGGTNTPPDYSVNFLLVPDQPYARGGHHFTNGATWVEQMARPLGLAGSVQPALRSSSGATNFAVGGARANADGSGVDLSSQVSGFLAAGAAPADALYVVEMGGNDLRDAFAAYATGHDGGPIIAGAVNSIASNIQTLYGAGARKFLVWNGPNIGLTPAIRSLGPAAIGLATKVTLGFNGGLDAALSALAALPGIQIVKLDVYAQLNALVASPAAFGLTNVQSACIQPGVAPFQCQNVDEYLFWDGIHPTAAAHAIIAQQAASLIPH